MLQQPHPKSSIFAIYLTERSTTLMLSWVRILAKTKPRLETLPTMSIVRSGATGKISSDTRTITMSAQIDSF